MSEDADTDSFGQVLEHFAFRNFQKGDRVIAYYEGMWYAGIVMRKYRKNGSRPSEAPVVMVRTDESVEHCPEAYLHGFGLECRVSGPRIRFERELAAQDEVYTKTFLRELTPEEKGEDIPF